MLVQLWKKKKNGFGKQCIYEKKKKSLMGHVQNCIKTFNLPSKVVFVIFLCC